MGALETICLLVRGGHCVGRAERRELTARMPEAGRPSHQSHTIRAINPGDFWAEKCLARGGTGQVQSGRWSRAPLTPWSTNSVATTSSRRGELAQHVELHLRAVPRERRHLGVDRGARPSPHHHRQERPQSGPVFPQHRTPVQPGITKAYFWTENTVPSGLARKTWSNSTRSFTAHPFDRPRLPHHASRNTDHGGSGWHVPIDHGLRSNYGMIPYVHTT